MNNFVYVIILNYQNWKDTIECLESVLKNDYENYQIIVVDNDSPNNSMKYIIDWAEGKQEVIYDETSQLKHLSQPFESKPLEYIYYTKEEALNSGNKEKELELNNPIIFIQSGENGGFAAGNNIGIKYALKKNDFEYIWLLNNDTVIEKNSLKEINYFAQNNKMGIIGSVLMDYHHPNKIQSYGGGYINKFFGTSHHLLSLQNIERKLDYIVGASCFIAKDVIQKNGLLPEEYFLYNEDSDYCFNAKKNDFYLGIALTSIVYHKESASTKPDKVTSEFIDLLSLKNRIIFHKKYLGGGLGLWLSLIIAMLKRIKRKQFGRSKKIFHLIYKSIGE